MKKAFPKKGSTPTPPPPSSSSAAQGLETELSISKPKHQINNNKSEGLLSAKEILEKIENISSQAMTIINMIKNLSSPSRLFV